MKSASLIVDPNQKFDELQNLGSRLKLPAGWKFRTLILEQDLVFMTDNGATKITQDEIGNTYDASAGSTATLSRRRASGTCVQRLLLLCMVTTQCSRKHNHDRICCCCYRWCSSS